MATLDLLDGTYELFRAYFAFPKRQSPDGREVGGVYGLLSTTLALLNEGSVTHIAAATDTVIRSFRNDLFDGYKTGDEVEPVLLAQFPLAERALECLGVTVWPMDHYEADDAIATAAARFASEVEQVRILSPDKDLGQCVTGDHVVLVNRRTNEVVNEEGVRAKFGVAPASIPDYLALVGDAADGIPGIPGWGAKSAATVLDRYGHLDAIPADAADWDVKVRGAAKLAERLAAQREDARLYRDLATLRTDVPLAETLADLEWRGVAREPFIALCDELGFGGIRERPARWAG
jgi:5'-3' exonuclease